MLRPAQPSKVIILITLIAKTPFLLEMGDRAVKETMLLQFYSEGYNCSNRYERFEVLGSENVVTGVETFSGRAVLIDTAVVDGFLGACRREENVLAPC